ncbi:MAG: MarR family transcriptional regulator [Hyphomicrobiales bacterium]|nr:MAG: MarR family transcriptional regulator [Hyphomicrobiales bacterium]
MPDQLDTPKDNLFGLLTEIGIIHQLMTTEFNRLMPDGLHISHFGVITHLCRMDGGWTPLRLANAFQVTKATMTNTLARLSTRGLVEVRTNPKDGRSKLVFITPEGRAFQKQAIASLQPFVEKMGQELDLESLIKILPQLQELREYFDSNRTA